MGTPLNHTVSEKNRVVKAGERRSGTAETQIRSPKDMVSKDMVSKEPDG